MDLEPIVQKLIADTRQFERPMRSAVDVTQRFNKAGEVIGTKMRVITKEMEQAGKKTSGFMLAMTRLSRTIKVLNTVADTAVGSVQQLYNAASEGAKIAAAEQFFRNAGKSIADYREATLGMISDAELMRKANLADSMGISEEVFKKLTLVAEASALKTGQSFDYMFNSIITGTARSSRLLLDNLGIIVSVKEANDRYAESVGKTVEELSNQEKQIAFADEVARKSTGTLAEYADLADKSAQNFAKFDASVQNLADSIKVALSNALAEVLPGLTDFMTQIAEMFKSGQWEEIGSYVGNKFMQGVYTVLGGDRAFEKFFGKSFFTQAAERYGEAARHGLEMARLGRLENRAQGENLLGSLLKQAQPNLPSELRGAGQKETLQFLANMSKTQREQLREIDPAWDTLIEKIKATARELGLFPKAVMAEVRGKVAPSKSGRGSKGSSVNVESEIRAQADAHQKMNEAIGETELRLDEEAAAAVERDIDLAEAEALRTRELKAAADAESKARAAVENLTATFYKVSKDAMAAFSPLLDIARGGGLFGPLTQLGDKLAKGAGLGDLGGAIAAGLNSAFGIAGSSAGPIGALVGLLIPLFAEILDRLEPVSEILSLIVEGLAKLVGNAVGPLLTALVPVFEGLVPLLASIGFIIGSAIDPITDMVGYLAAFVKLILASVGAFFMLLGTLVQFVNVLAGGPFLLGLFLGSLEGTIAVIDAWVRGMIESMVDFNNFVVRLARSLPGMSEFGQILDVDDFLAAQEDNTDAVKENTQALRDFAREFRNLPQQYKIAGTLHATADPERSRLNAGAVTRIGVDPSRLNNRVRDRL